MTSTGECSYWKDGKGGPEETEAGGVVDRYPRTSFPQCDVGKEG